MPKSVTESTVEDAALHWFEGMRANWCQLCFQRKQNRHQLSLLVIQSSLDSNSDNQPFPLVKTDNDE